MGRMVKGLCVIKNGCGVLGMAMVVCAGWFLDRRWVVNVYVIVIDDGERNLGLPFNLCFTVLGFPRDRVYIKFTELFVHYIHSF